MHRLVAYQKYGKEIFKKGIEVRHRDGNPSNNTENNILLGTPSENSMDKTQETRNRIALNATSFIKVHDHEQIIKRREEGATYKELMEQFGISSKNGINYIINKSQAAKKHLPVAQLEEQ